MHESQEQGIARIFCPSCGDWLAPAISLAEDLLPEEEADFLCLGCNTIYPWRDGVLYLGGAPGESRIKRQFTMGSDSYSFMQFLDYTQQLAVNTERTSEDELYNLLSWTDVYPGQVALLLGSDDGRMLPPLSQAIQPGVVVAIEQDEALLAASLQVVKRESLQNVVLVHGDLNNPPIRQGAFDRMMLLGVIHGEAKATTYIERISGALIHGGVMSGVALARSTLEHIASQQMHFGNSAGVTFTDMNAFGQELCRGDFMEFRLDQASNWMARFVSRKIPLSNRG